MQKPLIIGIQRDVTEWQSHSGGFEQLQALTVALDEDSRALRTTIY